MTQLGANLEHTLEASSTTYIITKTFDNFANTNLITHIISVDPDFHPKVIVGVGNSCMVAPASTAIILGHELGHAATNVLDDGPGSMNNVNQNENPLRQQLGLPPYSI
jgi:hypothetical protein